MAKNIIRKKSKSIAEFKVNIDIVSKTRDISVNEVWTKLVDWQDQSNWMMQTQVWSDIDNIEEKDASEVSISLNGVGVRIWAFTGLGARSVSNNFRSKSTNTFKQRARWAISSRFFQSLGLLDEMVITKWSPPLICEVDHVGKIIKGKGIFRLEKISNGVRFYWLEEIKAPKIILFLVRPIILFGVKVSLRKFKKLIISQNI